MQKDTEFKDENTRDLCKRRVVEDTPCRTVVMYAHCRCAIPGLFNVACRVVVALWSVCGVSVCVISKIVCMCI